MRFRFLVKLNNNSVLLDFKTEEYENMYKEVSGFKEPSPDVEEVQKFSVGQDADPSLMNKSEKK